MMDDGKMLLVNFSEDITEHIDTFGNYKKARAYSEPKKLGDSSHPPNILIFMMEMVPRGGIEPPTRGFSVCIYQILLHSSTFLTNCYH